MARIVCFGEMLIRMSPPGYERLLQTPALRAHIGGAEANTGVLLAQFGHDVEMVTTLPNTALGDACLSHLGRFGISSRSVVRSEGRVGLYYLEQGALMRPSTIIYDRMGSAFAECDPDRYDWERLLSGKSLLHVSGISLALGDRTLKAVRDAVRHARQLGVGISFDCNYRPALWRGRESEARHHILDVVRAADILFAGPRDAAFLLGGGVRDEALTHPFSAAADAFLKECPDLKLVCGTQRTVRSASHNAIQGFAKTRSGLAASRLFELDGIVDRVGTGDAFAAGILHQYFEQTDPDIMVEFATAASALKHSVVGDACVATLEEVQRTMLGGEADVRR